MAGLNISPYQAYNQTHNYSSLFAGINKASSDNGWDLSGLADYASIKNGSYGKLMKSSYAKSNAKSANTDTASKSTYKTAEERRKAREAAANSSTAASTDSTATLDGAAARRAAREAKANKTATAVTEENTTNVADTTAAAAETSSTAQDSARAIYNNNAVTSPSMSELMASTFDTNV